jgi:hypothetical protein
MDCVVAACRYGDQSFEMISPDPTRLRAPCRLHTPCVLFLPAALALASGLRRRITCSMLVSPHVQHACVTIRSRKACLCRRPCTAA